MKHLKNMKGDTKMENKTPRRSFLQSLGAGIALLVGLPKGAREAPKLLRPYTFGGGTIHGFINHKGPVPLKENGTALLRKDDWLSLDTAIMRVASHRARVFVDTEERVFLGTKQI